ncbi:MAG: signal peptidase II [Alphaproteobacteria bacterium]|nr:signal peptidase II [Alphaproteobacteria bacterium]MBU0797598.1 signal peptidase II [Alphaproteobacteria bacterium]MBU0886614.1 signal peptidase II [Alphaproteobacteria bacterium]MBU1812587.1 signal peptidase II [Alphaproteobacteria bacterium]
MIGAGCGSIALSLDQASKALVTTQAATLFGGVPVFPGFNLVFLRNDGVSFGLLGGVDPWLLIALALGVCCWLVAIMLRTDSLVEAAGCGLIVGGALGNIIDRLRHGAVTDFLDFYVGSWHWPAFNLADVFIFCGVAVLFLAMQGRARCEPSRS